MVLHTGLRRIVITMHAIDRCQPQRVGQGALVAHRTPSTATLQPRCNGAAASHTPHAISRYRHDLMGRVHGDGAVQYLESLTLPAKALPRRREARRGVGYLPSSEAVGGYGWVADGRTEPRPVLLW